MKVASSRHFPPILCIPPSSLSPPSLTFPETSQPPTNKELRSVRWDTTCFFLRLIPGLRKAPPLFFAPCLSFWFHTDPFRLKLRPTHRKRLFRANFSFSPLFFSLSLFNAADPVFNTLLLPRSPQLLCPLLFFVRTSFPATLSLVFLLIFFSARLCSKSLSPQSAVFLSPPFNFFPPFVGSTA